MIIKIYLIFIIIFFIVALPLLVLAVENNVPIRESSTDCPIDKFCPNVPFGDFQGHLDLGPELLGNYIRAWFNFIVGGVGILATVMIMYAGLKWLTSRGNTAVITDSKEKIWSAIIGMVLAFLSFTIFMVINPDLVSTYLPTLQSVDYDLPEIVADDPLFEYDSENSLLPLPGQTVNLAQRFNRDYPNESMEFSNLNRIPPERIPRSINGREGIGLSFLTNATPNVITYIQEHGTRMDNDAYGRQVYEVNHLTFTWLNPGDPGNNSSGPTYLTEFHYWPSPHQPEPREYLELPINDVYWP